MALEQTALQGASDLMDGKGTLVTALVLGIMIIGWMYWQLLRDSSAEKKALTEYNRTLTERLFNLVQDHGRIISAFTEKLNDVIRTKN